tara:strand:- start:366 stop:677 length:312 start_codon:yes stop_codon:yes gene_type:complete
MNFPAPNDLDLDGMPFGNATVSKMVENVLAMKKDVEENPTLLLDINNLVLICDIINDFTSNIHPDWCSESERAEITEIFMFMEKFLQAYKNGGDCDCPDCRGE